MRGFLLTVVAFLSLVSYTQALYFYLTGNEQKCFFEDLPKDTIVVGKYRVEELIEQTNSWATPSDLGLSLTVDELGPNDANPHRIVSQHSMGSSFTFTAASSSAHKICVSTRKTGGWFSSSKVRLHLDLALGETGELEKKGKEHLEGIAGRVRELKNRVNDVRREQVFQREREAEFRDLSESVNAHIARWTVAQIIVLSATGAWQLMHLRGFFQKQKLV
ncbi:ERP1 protein precursor [Saitoella complicata NRRL Y-17804]|uniref:GOLD domain-containing protein n=1 Tax=Saitoella complicata (strain BCRC 22490 / CBS 7301 / JCM 7358 / NBRC 10748 / NRRL Y-17804) TaxID=698492 RepID=A0A0E9NGM4_SAICN|nr:ERP1 protein precursor [Saitoella complicata NRRL Y-17804]ODQ54219.1 ERP1 protein precursor [Saitoella complicata NRRL Y-17804]GAO48555.1 hypothetical protein G7K_2728-t1 [Saitoella complicata NRRL Y-17804]